MRNIPCRAAALAILFAPVLGAVPEQSLWNQGDPEPDEQEAMEWLNRARRDPPSTLDAILSMGALDATVAGFLAYERPFGADDLRRWVEAGSREAIANAVRFPNSEAISSGPLAFYPLFQTQAAVWTPQRPLAPPPPDAARPADATAPVPGVSTLLSGPANVLGGPDATGGAARFGPFGATYAEASQALLYGPAIGPREWILTALTAGFPGGGWSPPPGFLLQGDPLPDLTLGHTRLAGIRIERRADGARLLTFYRGSSEFFVQSDLPFGNAGTVFITGVVYSDLNSNGAYDAGEGIAGVTVSPDRGRWRAVTSRSGGYAIPVPANSGEYRLTALGGPALPEVRVTIGSESVKADWETAAPPPPPVPQVSVAPADGENRLAGLSARAPVEEGERALIGGFVIAGPAGARKTVLLRGVGPSLRLAGIPADRCIPATRLDLYRDSRRLAANSGWTSAADGGLAAAEAAARVGDFPLLPPEGDRGDSALVIELAPGAYSAVVSPADGTPPLFQTGRIGLVEIYDTTPGDGSRLVNLSSRGFAGAGDRRMIVGWTVSGTGHARVLVRAVGPGLSAFGVDGFLPDPMLTLFDGAGAPLEANGDAGRSAEADQIRLLAAQSGAFALAEDTRDAAILARTASGNFTALVDAAPGTVASGLALVEAYEAP